MPSRRHLLAGVGATIAGGYATAVSGEIPEISSSPPDWPMSQYDPSGTGYNPNVTGPRAEVEPAWVHESTEWFRGASQPIRLGETLYAAGNGLLALSVDDGRRKFGRQGPYTSSLAAADAAPYQTPTLAVTSTGGIYGLNASGGIEIPGLDRAIGSERWQGPPYAEYRPSLEHSPTVNPVAHNGRVYGPVVGTNDIVAIEANEGSVRWRVTVNDDEIISASFGRPTIHEGTLFVANWPAQVSAYDINDGSTLWQQERDEQMQLCTPVTDAGVVVTSRNGVALLSASDGEPIWERDLDGNATEGTAAVTDTSVFLSDGLETFYAIDIETGETRWSTPFKQETKPVVADGVVYAVEQNASLVAFDVEAGTELFRYEPPEVPLSPPIVGDGRLYLANRSRVVALEESV